MSGAAAGAPSPPGLGDLREVPGFVAGLAIGVIVGLGFGLVIPVVPAFARSFGVGVFAATAIISVFAGVRLVSNLVTGPLVDGIGMRRAVGYGALIVGASSLASAIAPTYWWFLVARGLGGFGSALFLGALVTLVLVTAPASMRGRAVGAVQSSFLIGSAFGPTVGGALAEPLGLRWPFVIYAAACGIAGAVALTSLPRATAPPAADADDAENAGAGAGAGADADARADVAEDIGEGAGDAGGDGVSPVPRRGNPFAGFSQLLRTRELIAALVMVAGLRWALSGVRFSVVPLFAEDVLGAGSTLTGLALTVASVAQLLVVVPAGKAVDVAGRRRVGIVAFAAFAVVSAGFVVVSTGWAFLTAMALFGLTTGMSTPIPAAIVGDVVPADRAGRAVGVLNTAGDLGSVGGPLVLGVLVEVLGFDAAFVATAVVLAGAAVLALRMRETMPSAAG